MTPRESSRDTDSRAIAASPGLLRAALGFAAILATGLALGLMLGALVAVGSAASFSTGQTSSTGQTGARRAAPAAISPAPPAPADAHGRATPRAE